MLECICGIHACVLCRRAAIDQLVALAARSGTSRDVCTQTCAHARRCVHVCKCACVQVVVFGLVELAQSEAMNMYVTETVALALGALALGNLQNQAAIMNQGGIGKLLGMLHRGATMSMVDCAVQALRNMSVDNAEVKAAIVKEGGLEALRSLARAGPLKRRSLAVDMLGELLGNQAAIVEELRAFCREQENARTE